MEVRRPVPHNHPKREEMTDMEDPPLAESTLLAKGTHTQRTELTGTGCTPRKRTTLVTIAIHNALEQGAMPWACIPEEPA